MNAQRLARRVSRKAQRFLSLFDFWTDHGWHNPWKLARTFHDDWHGLEDTIRSNDGRAIVAEQTLTGEIDPSDKWFYDVLIEGATMDGEVRMSGQSSLMDSTVHGSVLMRSARNGSIVGCSIIGDDDTEAAVKVDTPGWSKDADD